MIFQRSVIEKIMQKAQESHNIELWKAMCRSLDHKHLYHSGCSEYEIYFNFVSDPQNKEHILRRPLKWANIGDLNYIRDFQKDGYDYVSCHDYLRPAASALTYKNIYLYSIYNNYR